MSDMMNGNNGSLELSIDDQTGVAVMSIANRDKRNALNPYIMAQLSDAISRLEKWANGKAVILRGKDNVFCSGADLDFVLNNMHSRGAGYLYSSLMHSNMNRFKALPFLKVAAIEGYAIGGGAEIAMACDHLVMKSGAKMGFVHIRVGIITGWSGGSRLVHKCGPTAALDLMWSGRVLTADQCLSVGLIDKVLDDSDRDFIVDCIGYLKDSARI